MASRRQRVVGSALLVLCFSCGGPRTERVPAESGSAVEGTIATKDGVRLYYRKVGRGPVKAIVPGALFYSDAVQDRMGRRQAVLFYDMRNRGRSERVDDSSRITIRDDVSDLESVRQAMGVVRFTPIGWSYLGMMVMLYAREHPDRVDSVVQLGPLARRLGTRYPPELMADDAQGADAARVAELERLRASDLVTRDPPEACRRDWAIMRVRLVGDPARAGGLPDPCGWPNEWPVRLRPHFATLFASIGNSEPPSWDEFAALRARVLTIHGKQDRNVPYGSGLEWAAHLADARLITVEGVAHAVWVDALDVVLGAIDRFLGGEWPAEAMKVDEPPPTLAAPR